MAIKAKRVRYGPLCSYAYTSTGSRSWTKVDDNKDACGVFCASMTKRINFSNYMTSVQSTWITLSCSSI